VIETNYICCDSNFRLGGTQTTYTLTKSKREREQEEEEDLWAGLIDAGDFCKPSTLILIIAA